MDSSRLGELRLDPYPEEMDFGGDEESESLTGARQITSGELKTKKYRYLAVAAVVSFIMISLLTGGLGAVFLASGAIVATTFWSVFGGVTAISLLVSGYFLVSNVRKEKARKYLEQSPYPNRPEDCKNEEGYIDWTQYSQSYMEWQKNASLIFSKKETAVRYLEQNPYPNSPEDCENEEGDIDWNLYTKRHMEWLKSATLVLSNQEIGNRCLKINPSP